MRVLWYDMDVVDVNRWKPDSGTRFVVHTSRASLRIFRRYVSRVLIILALLMLLMLDDVVRTLPRTDITRPYAVKRLGIIVCLNEELSKGDFHTFPRPYLVSKRLW